VIRECGAGELTQEARRQEGNEAARAFRREHRDVDAADAALLELQRAACADQPRRQLAKIRLVPDQRHRTLVRVPGQFLDHGVGGAARGEGVGQQDVRFRLERVGDDLGGLTGPHQRTRNDDAGAHADGLQPLRLRPHAGDTLGRQGPL